MQVKRSILNFYLLVLKILLDLGLNTYYQYGRFSETLLEKDFKLIVNKKNNTIIFNSSFILLLIEVDFVLEKQSYKKDTFMITSIRHVKIVLILVIKIIAFHILALIIQVRVLGYKKSILKCKICLAIFLAFNK